MHIVFYILIAILLILIILFSFISKRKYQCISYGLILVVVGVYYYGAFKNNSNKIFDTKRNLV